MGGNARSKRQKKRKEERIAREKSEQDEAETRTRQTTEPEEGGNQNDAEAALNDIYDNIMIDIPSEIEPIEDDDSTATTFEVDSITQDRREQETQDVSVDKIINLASVKDLLSTLPVENPSQTSSERHPREPSPAENLTLTSPTSSLAQVPDGDIFSAQIADLNNLPRPREPPYQLVSSGEYPTQQHVVVAIKRQQLAQLEAQGDRLYFAKYGMFPHRPLDGVNIIAHLEVRRTNGISISKDKYAPFCGMKIAAEACSTLQLLCNQAFQYYPPLFELYQSKSWEAAKQIIQWKMNDVLGYVDANNEIYSMVFDHGVKRSRVKNVEIWIAALMGT